VDSLAPRHCEQHRHPSLSADARLATDEAPVAREQSQPKAHSTNWAAVKLTTNIAIKRRKVLTMIPLMATVSPFMGSDNPVPWKLAKRYWPREILGYASSTEWLPRNPVFQFSLSRFVNVVGADQIRMAPNQNVVAPFLSEESKTSLFERSVLVR
jgi:hypothetical protein